MDDLSSGGALPRKFRQRYARALEEWLADPAASQRMQAHALGREALAGGVPVINLVTLHHETLHALVLRWRSRVEAEDMAEAGEFLAECLAPYEIALRSARDTNTQLVREMADRQRAEESLRQAQRFEVIGRIAGGVAHDFNNILTVMDGMLDSLAPQAAEDARLQGLVDAAKRASARGARVTRGLLACSRQQKLTPQPQDATTTLHELVGMLGATLRGNIRVETDISPGLGTILVDRAELELALMNLVLNARDAMPDGGVLRIGAAMRDAPMRGLAGPHLVVTVADTGTGIAPEVLAKVFDPFFTTKEAGAGSGLGLSQVQGFAALSGGAVDLASVPGTGTTVRLCLPADSAPAAAFPPVPQPVAAKPKGGRVLLVEDDPEVAELTCASLEDCGLEVRCCDRAAAALDALEEGGVDVVFSDVMMPDGMSGFQLAERVRERFPAVPVLLTTGFSEAAETAASRGVPLLVKPYRIRELYAHLSNLLLHRGTA